MVLWHNQDDSKHEKEEHLNVTPQTYVQCTLQFVYIKSIKNCGVADKLAGKFSVLEWIESFNQMYNQTLDFPRDSFI